MSDFKTFVMGFVNKVKSNFLSFVDYKKFYDLRYLHTFFQVI